MGTKAPPLSLGPPGQGQAPIRRFAVFGDVHGRLRLLFELCRRWQLTHKVHLDGILQCGDLGFFPDRDKLDRATRRHAERDPEELGYSTWFASAEFNRKDPRLQATLLGDPHSLATVRCPVLWCAGNHEDFAALSQALGGRDLGPVDPLGRLLLLKGGAVTEYCGIRVAALGGASEVHADRREGGDPIGKQCKHVSVEAGLRLLGRSFDVLLSHDAPAGVKGLPAGLGSPCITEVLRNCHPQFHFYAHHTQPLPITEVGRTRCHWLANVAFARHRDGTAGLLYPGCMGILEQRSGGLAFQVLDEPWFQALDGRNWRHG